MVWGRIGTIALGRLDVEGRGRLSHGLQAAVGLLRALWEEREAAVTRILKEELGVGQVAGHKLGGLAVPRVKEGRARVLFGAAKVRRCRLVDRGADGSARGGGFARRVGEGRRRGLVGIQLHGVVAGGTRGGELGRTDSRWDARQCWGTLPTRAVVGGQRGRGLVGWRVGGLAAAVRACGGCRRAQAVYVDKWERTGQWMGLMLVL